MRDESREMIDQLASEFNADSLHEIALFSATCHRLLKEHARHLHALGCPLHESLAVMRRASVFLDLAESAGTVENMVRSARERAAVVKAENGVGG